MGDTISIYVSGGISVCGGHLEKVIQFLFRFRSPETVSCERWHASEKKRTYTYIIYSAREMLGGHQCLWDRSNSPHGTVTFNHFLDNGASPQKHCGNDVQTKANDLQDIYSVVPFLSFFTHWCFWNTWNTLNFSSSKNPNEVSHFCRWLAQPLEDPLFDHPHHPVVACGARPGLLVLPEELPRVLPVVLYGAAAERHEDLPRHCATHAAHGVARGRWSN